MEKIGPYQILGILHSGPRPLCRAKTADGRVVALKTISAAGLTSEVRERFIRESEICIRLDHPNLIRVYDAGEADGMLYQALDLLEGADLGHVLSEGRPFSWEEKLLLMEQVCDGLQYVHARKLAHRDLKPSNLFLENSRRIRILDFGMVRVESWERTEAGSTPGKLSYRAPEQIRGEECTAASDLFSAGVVFYQLATGCHPFASRESSSTQVLSAIVCEAPQPLAQLAPDAPDGLDLILNKSLEKGPAKRWQNAGEFRQALALCRTTLKLKPGAGTSAAWPAAAEAVSEAQAGPAEVDAEKTRVIKRPAGFTPSPPRSPAPPPTDPAHRAPRTSTMAELRYCPSCTHANLKAATHCACCGLPLVPISRQSNAGESMTRWGLYAAVGGVALLVALLIVVLLVR